MTERIPDAPEPNVLDLYEETSNDGLVCRVCGVLVPRFANYPTVHWDWHEASNGA
jgi:hypothetical protein